MRLIELVAVIIHQIAVQLFNTERSLHKDDSIASWEPPKELRHFWLLNPDGAPPTLFQHRQYRYYDQYPDGIADGVGYWAESRIFGGVVLFDRREPDSADDVHVSKVHVRKRVSRNEHWISTRYYTNYNLSLKIYTYIQSVRT